MTYDVAIYGNGLSSNLFALNLQKVDSGLKIAIIGRETIHPYSVGESVTELASHFLQHKLGFEQSPVQRSFA